MTFRQHEIFAKQLAWFSALLVGLTVFLCVSSGTVSVPLTVCSILIALLAVHIWRAEPIVTVDEWGVVCGDPERPLWDYSWAEIAQLRRITHFRSPAVQLIPVDEPSRDIPLLGFQLSRKAKTALRKYCPGYRE